MKSLYDNEGYTNDDADKYEDRIMKVTATIINEMFHDGYLYHEIDYLVAGAVQKEVYNCCVDYINKKRMEVKR